MVAKKVFFYSSFFILIGLLIADAILELTNNSVLIIKILELCSAVLSSLSLCVSINFSKNVQKNTSKQFGGVGQTLNIGNNNSFNAPILQSGTDLKNELELVSLNLEQLKNENVEKICNMVLEKLKNKEIKGAVDRDFAIKYVSDAASISDVYIQNIWAEILEKKVSENYSISKRMLDIVKNLSSDEAKIFENIAKLSDEKGIIFKPFKEKISFADWSFLTDVGLIKSHDVLKTTIHISKTSKRALLVNNNNFLILAVNNTTDNDETIEFPCSWLTREGLQLKQILNLKIQDSSFDILLNFFKETCKNKNIDFELHKIISFDGNNISYEPNNL